MHYSGYQNSAARHRRRPRRGIIVLSCLAAIFIAAIYIWQTAGNRASNAQISNGKKGTNVAAFKNFADSYITFRYRSVYIEKQTKAYAPELDAHVYSGATTHEKVLSATVWQTPPAGISGDGGYETFKAQPDKYYAMSLPVGGSLATAWINKDGSEEAVYIPHDKISSVITLSASGTNDNSDLQPEMAAILQSFHWK